MGSEQRTVKGDLDGVAHESDLDGLTAVAVADAIAGSRKAHGPVLVDDTQNL